jgi:hypothetical protein
MSFRGSPQIRVNLKRYDVHSDTSEYLVAIYGVPGEASEKAARKWGERLTAIPPCRVSHHARFWILVLITLI